MKLTIKTGDELIDEFFSEISSLEGVDQKITEKLSEIYHDKRRLTKTTLDRAIQELDSGSEQDEEGGIA